MAEQPIISEVEASDQTVEAVRAAIPVGVSGAPIDRLPLHPELSLMAKSGLTTKRIAGTDRCIRVVDVPLRGGATGQFHCSRACVRLGDMQLCPEHDKAAFAPVQSPVAKGRTINSASIELGAGEKAELVKISKSFATHGENPPNAIVYPPTAPVAGVPPVAASADKTGAEPPHDLKIYLRLDELAGRDVLDVLQARIVEALDGLPCRTVREMKQIVALQEKIAKLSKGGKRNGRVTAADSSNG
jgi:hypothetical protein